MKNLRLPRKVKKMIKSRERFWGHLNRVKVELNPTGKGVITTVPINRFNADEFLTDLKILYKVPREVCTL